MIENGAVKIITHNKKQLKIKIIANSFYYNRKYKEIWCVSLPTTVFKCPIFLINETLIEAFETKT